MVILSRHRHAANSQITGTGDGYARSWSQLLTFRIEFDPADLRRKPTFMVPGDHYPEIDQAAGGYTYPAGGSAQGTNSAVKKYVSGHTCR